MVDGKALETLFDQTNDLEIIGGRLSGDPEIVHEIEDHFRQVQHYPIIRPQIKKILELVPLVFPEDWKSPKGYDELDSRQQEAYAEIAKAGIAQCPGPVIQRVIELAVLYRDKYSKAVSE